MSSIPKTSGIYKITCTANGKIYVGSSNNIRKRWRDHKNDLCKNKHCNQHLQNAYNKYGEQSFVFEIVELVMSWSLFDRENYWLKTLKPYDHDIGFNISHGADGGMVGCKHSLETREKMSISAKDRTFSIETRAKLSEWQVGRKISHETIERRVAKTKKRYIFITPDGDEFQSIGLVKFCSEHELSSSAMSKVANNKRDHHKGWKCRHA